MNSAMCLRPMNAKTTTNTLVMENYRVQNKSKCALEMMKESRPMTEIFRYDFAEPVKLYFLAKRDGGLERDNDAEVLEPLSDYQKEVIRHAVDSFRDVEMDRLIELVYATDPLVDVELHEPIEIVRFATRHVCLYGQLKA